MGGIPYIKGSLKGFQGIGTKRLYTPSPMFKWMMMPRRGHRLAVMRFCASVRPSAGALPNASQRQRQHSPEGGAEHAERLKSRRPQR
jgi:hypothetical protein